MSWFEMKRLTSAVLRIKDGGQRFEALDFADSDDAEVGDLVLAIGNPFGVGQTVTSGIVSAVARTDIGINDLSFFIQTDAAINPGNSGGPLVDMNGDIVGLNTAIFTRSGGSHGIGFAIPSNMVRSVVAQALAGSTEIERPWIGASFQRVTHEIAENFGLIKPRGALITEVERRSPAAKAGLKRGDIILRVNGRRISNPAAFEYRLAVLGVGQSARLIVLRKGKRLQVNLPLERPPETVPREPHAHPWTVSAFRSNRCEHFATYCPTGRSAAQSRGCRSIEGGTALTRGTTQTAARRCHPVGAGSQRRICRRA